MVSPSTRGNYIAAEADGGVLVLVINRPDKANALPRAAKAELAERLLSAGSDASTRAIVITGEGRSFCAGSDIGEMSTFGPIEMHRMLRDEHEMYLAALRSPKPVVAAVNGFALGAGAILAFCCDYVVAADSARIGTPELTLGVTAPLEGLLLPFIVGLGHARAMFYDGRQLSADEASRVGLVHEVVAPSSCRDAAVRSAHRLAALPGHAFAAQKRSLYHLLSGAGLTAAIDESQLATAALFGTDETPRAMRAFLERKRQATSLPPKEGMDQ